MKQRLLFILDGHAPVEIEARTFKAAIVMIATQSNMDEASYAIFRKSMSAYDEVKDRNEIVYLYNLCSCYPSILAVHVIADTIFSVDAEE